MKHLGLSLPFLALLLTVIWSLPSQGQSIEPNGCEEFNRSATCASAPPDRKLTEAELFQSLEVTGDLNRFFRTDIPQTQKTQNERATFVHKLWTKMDAFGNRYYCEPKYELATHPMNYDSYEVDSYLTSHGKELNSSNRDQQANAYNQQNVTMLKQKLSDFLQLTKSWYDNDENLTYCANHPISRVDTVVAVVHQPCVFEISKNLPDNEYRVEKYIEEIKKSKNFEEGLRCLEGKMNYLSHITVLASSNALNNTTPEFCKKDFLGLSKARAERARDTILPLILQGKEKDIEVELNYTGHNGNGTTGPCPYHQRPDGREEMIPGFQKDPEMQTSLAKGKYLVIRFEFDGKHERKINEPYQVDHMVPCGHITLSCKH